MNDSIILYSSPSCPKCRMLKMELTKNSIPFTTCEDIETINNLHIVKLPTLSINGELFGMQDSVKWIKENSQCK